MLGKSRQAINNAITDLQNDNLIRSTRGRITIIDQSSLESRACECYRIIKDERDRFLGP